MAAKDQDGHGTDQVDPQAEFARAFKDLQRGEQTATALENHLSALEKKIDELLASAEENQNVATKKTESSQEAAESSTDKSANTTA